MKATEFYSKSLSCCCCLFSNISVYAVRIDKSINFLSSLYELPIALLRIVTSFKTQNEVEAVAAAWLGPLLIFNFFCKDLHFKCLGGAWLRL